MSVAGRCGGAGPLRYLQATGAPGSGSGDPDRQYVTCCRRQLEGFPCAGQVAFLFSTPLPEPARRCRCDLNDMSRTVTGFSELAASVISVCRDPATASLRAESLSARSLPTWAACASNRAHAAVAMMPTTAGRFRLPSVDDDERRICGPGTPTLSARATTGSSCK